MKTAAAINAIAATAITAMIAGEISLRGCGVGAGITVFSPVVGSGGVGMIGSYGILLRSNIGINSSTLIA